MPIRFRDRAEAGRRLAEIIVGLGLSDPVVLGLPRGGVPVAAEVVARVGGTLDVFVARKVGAPGHEELGIGAIAEGSDEVVLSAAAAATGIDRERIEALADRTGEELARRVRAYRGERRLPDIAGRDVVVVDDGLATGVTAEAALRALSSRGPRRLILAVPVAAQEALDRLGEIADHVVCVAAPAEFYAVGQWYDDFPQLTDEEVIELLRGATSEAGARGLPE